MSWYCLGKLISISCTFTPSRHLIKTQLVLIEFRKLAKCCICNIRLQTFIYFLYEIILDFVPINRNISTGNVDTSNAAFTSQKEQNYLWLPFYLIYLIKTQLVLNEFRKLAKCRICNIRLQTFIYFSYEIILDFVPINRNISTGNVDAAFTSQKEQNYLWLPFNPFNQNATCLK